MNENKVPLQQQQEKKLAEMGSYLCQLRTQQCKTIEEIAACTRINARFLRAIEEGKLDQLPEPVYVQGFIKHFGDALGLNGDEFAKAFPTGVTVKRSTLSWGNSWIPQLRPFHLYLFYICLVVGSVSGLSVLINPSKPQITDKEPNSSPAQSLPTPGNLDQTNSQAQLALTKIPSSPHKPVQVDITLKGRSWLLIVADGKKKYEGILEEGAHQTWVANEKLFVKAGDAGNVIVEFNNQQAKQMGAPGAVEALTFAAKPRPSLQ